MAEKDKVCCCCSNKGGTLVLAVLHFISAAFSVIGAIGMMAQGASLPGDSPGQRIFSAILSVGFGSLLWFGVKKEKSGLLLVWLILDMIGIVFQVIISLIVLVIACVMLFIGVSQEMQEQMKEKMQMNGEAFPIELGAALMFGLLLLLAIVIGIQVWLWVMVNSARKEIAEGTQMTQYAQRVTVTTVEAGGVQRPPDINPGYGFQPINDKPPPYNMVNEKH